MNKPHSVTFDVDGQQLAEAWQRDHKYGGMSLDQFKHAAEMWFAISREGWTMIGFPSAEGPKVRFCNTKAQFEVAGANQHEVMEKAWDLIFGKRRTN